MRVHVNIEFEDGVPDLHYSYAIDSRMNDELTVPPEPPLHADMLDLIRWQERREKQHRLVKMISDQIGLAFGHGLDAPKPSSRWPAGDPPLRFSVQTLDPK